MDYEIECTACGKPSHNMIDFRCPSCGQPLEVRLRSNFKEENMRKQEYNVWRYSDSFPYIKDSEITTLGEGWTPLVKFSDSICFKLESLNPTGSFKDRGSTVLVSTLHELIKRAGGYLSEDSSGNAGASIAAYAARAGLKAKIYVPETVSDPKFNQIQFYGASVVKVPGNRSRVAEEAQKVEKGKFYVGHILHPLFRDGIRSLAYEITEQYGWDIPEQVYLPVSAGTLLLGMIKGFKHLLESKVIDAIPKIIACQTQQVSPLYHRLKNLIYNPPERVTSIADALVSVNPPLLDLMVKNLKEVNGDAVIVEENEILTAFTDLGKKGFLVEPSSAVAYAAYKKQARSKKISGDERATIVLTGIGLKTTLNPNR